MKLFLESFEWITFFGSPQNDFSFYKKKIYNLKHHLVKYDLCLKHK